MELALRRIEKNKKSQAPYLDLSFCDLHFEVPAELLSDFNWLKGIAFGVFDGDFSDKPGWLAPGYERKGRKNRLTGRELEGIKLPNLQEIYCYDIGLETVRFLRSARSLQKAILDKNKIHGILPLNENCLTYLSVPNNQIKNSTQFNKFTSLQELNLIGNPIENTDGFNGLINVKRLYLTNTQLTDVTFLAGLTNLEVLIANNNQITNAQPLGYLKELKDIALSNNQIKDIEFITRLPKLKELYVKNNRIERLTTELLLKFGKLEKLSIAGNPVSGYSERQLESLEKRINKNYPVGNDGIKIENIIILACMLLICAVVGGIIADGKVGGFIIGALFGPTIFVILLGMIKSPHPRYRK